MKLLALLLAAAGLTGCVAYGDPGIGYHGPGYSQGYYSQGIPYVVEPQPVLIYGSGGHGYGPGFRHRGWRDMDGDGIPNRFDRDRDGDGVPNRLDRRPSNPRRH